MAAWQPYLSRYTPFQKETNPLSVLSVCLISTKSIKTFISQSPETVSKDGCLVGIFVEITFPFPIGNSVFQSSICLLNVNKICQGVQQIQSRNQKCETNRRTTLNQCPVLLKCPWWVTIMNVFILFTVVNNLNGSIVVNLNSITVFKAYFTKHV